MDLWSARGELQSLPLAGQVQACGRLHTGGRSGGPDGTCRGHWLLPMMMTLSEDVSEGVGRIWLYGLER